MKTYKEDTRKTTCDLHGEVNNVMAF